MTLKLTGDFNENFFNESLKKGEMNYFHFLS